MFGGHVFHQASGADAEERHAIAVARVHVRLDLEDEPGEVRVGRLDQPRLGRCAARGLGASESSASEERLDAEVVQRAAEEDGRLAPRAVRGRDRSSCRRPTMIATASISSRCALGPDGLRDQRVRGVRDGHGLVAAAAPLSLVQEQRVRLEVVDAAEIDAVAERPVHRRGGNAEHALDLVHQLERILRRLIELVDERQHRQPRARHTSNNFSVCASMPLAASSTMTTLSTASSVR